MGKSACPSSLDTRLDRRKAETKNSLPPFFFDPSQGCFSKNGAAYWSNGSPEQITAEVVAPLQERVYCGLAGKDDFLLENGSSLRSIGIASAALVAVGAALM